MVAIMIIFNQALSEEIIDLLNDFDIRGFTKFNDLQGRGSLMGEPKMGTHTWPALNNAVMSVIMKEKAETLIDALNRLNRKSPEPGLKAFSWEVDLVVA